MTMNAISIISLAATLPRHPELSASIQYQLVGMAVVIGALASLWLVIALIGSAFRAAVASAPAPVDAQGTPVSPGALSAAPHAGVDPEIVAVIAAAVHATLGGGYLVTSIRPVHHVSPEDNVKLLAWSAEGRRQIFSSHRIR
jgi:Na+-transporting methylmalonyl-CoA/oxaloacetate decarboxylase gamma subunit